MFCTFYSIYTAFIYALTYMYVFLSFLRWFFSRKKVKRRGISPHLCFFYYFQYVRFYSFLSVDFIVLSNFDCQFPSVALVFLGTRYLVLGTWHLALGTINFTSYFLFLISYFFLLQLYSRVLTFLSRFPLQAA